MSESSLESTEGYQQINQSIYRPELGHIVDQRYKLIRKIGEGGMGYVYLAEQLNISRNVVIKLLKPEFCINDEQLSRFKREAELASKLSHPNCVTIHDFGFHKRAPYIVMEFLEGQALSELMFYKKEHLSIAEVSHYIGQVCDALEVAQDLGVVHRDLKPENIFVLEEALGGLNIKVLDFGIAKLAHNHPEASSSNLTRGDMVFGTPQYMAPEQIRGKPLDHRADVYALTVILFEMLTGKVPYEQNDPSDLVGILTQHLRDPIPQLKPETLHPEAVRYCGALNQIIQAGMAKKPEERLSTTIELKKRLALLAEASLVEDELPKRPTADTLPTPHQDQLTHEGEGQRENNNSLNAPQFEPSLTGDETIGMSFTDPLIHDSAVQQTLQSGDKKGSIFGKLVKFALFLALLSFVFALALTYPQSPLKKKAWQAKKDQLPSQLLVPLNRFEKAVSPLMFSLYESLNLKVSSSVPAEQRDLGNSDAEKTAESEHKQLIISKIEQKDTEEDPVQARVETKDPSTEQVNQQLDTKATESKSPSQVGKSKTVINTSNIAVIVFESNQDCTLTINQKTQSYQIKKGTQKRLPVRFGSYTLSCVNQEQQSCKRELNVEERKKYISTCKF